MWFAMARSAKGLDVTEEPIIVSKDTAHDNVANLSDYKSKPDDNDKKDGGKKAA